MLWSNCWSPLKSTFQRVKSRLCGLSVCADRGTENREKPHAQTPSAETSSSHNFYQHLHQIRSVLFTHSPRHGCSKYVFRGGQGRGLRIQYRGDQTRAVSQVWARVLSQECANDCCEPETCKLTEGSTCAHGECCENCQVRAFSSPASHIVQGTFIFIMRKQ